jgi:molybdate transport system substrate-binding protein
MTLRFVSAGAAQALVLATAQKKAIDVEGHFGAVGAMLERYRAGEACDVVILTDAQVAALVAEGRVVAGAFADIGSVPTAVAVREGEASPDVSDAERLRSALRAADAVYFPDPARATAGIHFAKVLDALGIRDELAARLRTFPNGATAMRELAKAPGHPIGCTQATEIRATPGVKLVAPLPRGLDLSTVYTAGVDSQARHASEARGFVSSLTGDAFGPDRLAAGFEGHAIRPARERDHPAIRAIVRDVLAEYRLSCSPADTDSDLADLRASYFDRGGNMDSVVAEDGSVVGCCGVYPLDRETCELRKMYLVPGARGKGLGRRLLQRALAFARGSGFRRVELETASVLKDAIALYTRNGFRPIERTHLASRCDQAFALDL